MLPLGTQISDFALLEPLTGKSVSSADFAGKPLLLAFVCNHCPFVIHIRPAFVELARQAQAHGVAVLAISSNDAEKYPDDSPQRMAEEARAGAFSFPYLFDADQSVAKAFRAACTPDFFLFDADGKLYYRGQFDAARPGNDVPVTGVDLQAALDALLAGHPAPAEQVPSLGCNIKWKPGAEPDYFG
jgi:peroxiredoxin